jgi:mannose-6-phosphate isomerase-like protein (cupin superfamily)
MEDDVPEPIQRFKYGGPDGEGARDARGLTAFLLALTNNVVSTVQIFPKGAHNNLHVHLTEDGYWLVLGGRARFYGEGETIIAELGKYEGVLITAGTKYWFEGISDEPLEILRVNYRVHPGPRHAVNEAEVPIVMAAAARGESTTLTDTSAARAGGQRNGHGGD